MKATSNNDSHYPQNQQKKGVTFDAMEMLERNSDCIDSLTTLVSDLKITMDRKQTQYKPKIYQGRPQNLNVGRQNFTPRNRSFSRGRNQGGNRGNYNNRNNYRPNYRNRSRGRWNNHRSGDRSGNYPHYTRQGNTRPHHRQNTQWTFRNRSQSRSRNENYGNDHFRGRSRDRNQRRQEESRSRSNSRVSTNRDHVQCYRCREYDHFASECPNTLTDEETDYEDTDPASLEMISQDYGPIDSERDSLKKESWCLTERQADHVYKAMKKGNMINTKIMTSKMTQNQDDNPYKRVVLNNVYKIPEKCPEMKNWSILVIMLGMYSMTK